MPQINTNATGCLFVDLIEIPSKKFTFGQNDKKDRKYYIYSEREALVVFFGGQVFKQSKSV
ncbi:hypothetical protein BpHYR1_032137 [Brachionus plicatilis]|uniref:Uncharacterized protein n=1 Tax=Brachionus plicatilis TaxID=10195 RepID=A0A3M7QP65_BRAPC|nr:hypothetical protein BpHYR1_032137 [Brachionus plicatilis]